MDFPPTARPPAVVLDASFVIGFCSREADKFAAASAQFEIYIQQGRQLFAPGVMVFEVLYVLCNKVAKQIITLAEYDEAIADLLDILEAIEIYPGGDRPLIQRATRMCGGCSHMNDSFYLALAEQLAAYRPAELATFDTGYVNQSQLHAPTVTIRLLPIDP